MLKHYDQNHQEFKHYYYKQVGAHSAVVKELWLED